MGFLDVVGFVHYPLESDSPEVEALLQKLNERNALILYLYIAAILLFFAASKLIRHVYIRNRRLRKELRLLAMPCRTVRRWCIRRAYWPWRTHGEMIVILSYLIINVVTCSVRARPELRNIQIARRTGWMSIINFALLILLSMKNTPLSKLTGYSYERLNVFHRWVALTAWFQGVVHTVAIALGTAALVPSQVHILISWENIMGIVALAAWTIMMLSFPLLRRISYESFYVIHIVFSPLVIITLYLHNKHCREPVLVAVGLYALDRFIRTDRYIWHNRHAHKLKATLQVTEDNSTLVSVPRCDFKWAPGSHAFLNIPRLRYFQSHPFTIASTGNEDSHLGEKKDVQFLIQPKKGFTGALYREARRADGDLRKRRTKEVTAYIDGPYGAVPDFTTFDRIILIAAGSGVTFILPIAISLLRTGRVKSIDFIWSVREQVALEPVRQQLQEISHHASRTDGDTLVNVRLHITGKTKLMRRASRVERMASKVMRKPVHQIPYDAYGSTASLGLEHNARNSARLDSMPRRPGISPFQRKNSGFSGGHSRNNSDSPLLAHAGFPSPDYRDETSMSPAFSPGMRTQRRVSSQRSSMWGDYEPTLPATPPAEKAVTGSPGLDSWGQVAALQPSHPFSPRIASANFDIEVGVVSEARYDPALNDDSSIDGDEKEVEEQTEAVDPLSSFCIRGRPDIPSLIAQVIDGAADFDTVAVGGCGVTMMMDEIRAVVADKMDVRGPSLSVFCEEFGW